MALFDSNTLREAVSAKVVGMMNPTNPEELKILSELVAQVKEDTRSKKTANDKADADLLLHLFEIRDKAAMEDPDGAKVEHLDRFINKVVNAKQ